MGEIINMEGKSNRLKSIIDSAIQNIQSLINVDTIIGTPIKNEENDVIIPVSKVTFGILSGGGEYGKVTIFKNEEDLPYSAGNGTVVQIKPCGFLIKTKENDYKALSISDNSLNNLIEKTTEFISKVTTNNEEN